jgi:diguanylate cyclase (GGDEF)-like protein
MTVTPSGKEREIFAVTLFVLCTVIVVMTGLALRGGVNRIAEEQMREEIYVWARQITAQLALSDEAISLEALREASHLTGLPVSVVAFEPDISSHTGYDAKNRLYRVALQNREISAGLAVIRLDEDFYKSFLWRHLEEGAYLFVLLGTLLILIPGSLFLIHNRSRGNADEEIRFAAEHDPCTGLLNRTAFMEHLTRLVHYKTGQNKAFALHLVDIDRFRDWNEIHGHNMGDTLIREIAHKLEAYKGGVEVARVGPDQFLVIQKAIEIDHHVHETAKNLHELLSRPMVLNGQKMSVPFSIGSALFPRDAEESGALIYCAELALLNAKQAGGAMVCCYTEEMSRDCAHRRQIEQRVREAASHDEFELVFQPIIDRMGLLEGFEALLRLTGPDGNPVSPQVFISIAEEKGLINSIGRWVLHQACTLAANWPKDLRVAVNLSALQFVRGDLPQIVQEILDDTGMAAHRLELEITESLLLQDSENVLNQLQSLKAMGVSIAMDDFGTGYSSLSYLWRFPFDRIKIDRSFIEAWNTKDIQISTIVRSIISLGHSLGIQVTAEGIENAEQAAFLTRLHCDSLQGFWFGRPMPAQNAATLILRQIVSSQKRLPPLSPIADNGKQASVL